MRKIFKILFCVVISLCASGVFAALSDDCYKSCANNPDPNCNKTCFNKNNQFQASTQPFDCVNCQKEITPQPGSPINSNGDVKLGSEPPPQPKIGYGSPSLFDKLKSAPEQRGQAVPLSQPERGIESTAPTSSTDQQPASIFH